MDDRKLQGGGNFEKWAGSTILQNTDVLKQEPQSTSRSKGAGEEGNYQRSECLK